MGRSAFFSFHFKQDSWRASQIRNIGAIEGNSPVTDNDWEEIKKSGDKAVENWINKQLKNRSCTVVLVGENTAGRKWINYEIKESWELGKGIVGIHIHNIKNKDGEPSNKGRNPFDEFKLGDKKLSNIVKSYDPPYKTSTNVYDYIKENITNWVEEAIDIRKKN